MDEVYKLEKAFTCDGFIILYERLVSDAPPWLTKGVERRVRIARLEPLREFTSYEVEYIAEAMLQAAIYVREGQSVADAESSNPRP